MFSCTVEGDLDGPVLSGMNGGFWKGGNRATTGSTNIGNDQVRFPDIPEFKGVGYCFPLNDLTEIMRFFFKFERWQL